MTDSGYAASGISVIAARGDGEYQQWVGLVEFSNIDQMDADNAPRGGLVPTCGSLRTSAFIADSVGVDGLALALDAVMAGAESMGITWRLSVVHERPMLSMLNRSRGAYLPEGWHPRLAAQADRLGWATYPIEDER